MQSAPDPRRRFPAVVDRRRRCREQRGPGGNLDGEPGGPSVSDPSTDTTSTSTSDVTPEEALNLERIAESVTTSDVAEGLEGELSIEDQIHAIEAQMEEQDAINATDTKVTDPNSDSNTTADTNTTVTSVSHLTPQAEEHIFRGSINNEGKATGYHWEGDPTSPGQVDPGTVTPPDARGVYEAQVTVNGIPKTANNGYSSFFPSWMSRQDVLDSIEEAYNNRMWVQNNTYVGETSTGMVMQMFVNAKSG